MLCPASYATSGEDAECWFLGMMNSWNAHASAIWSAYLWARIAFRVAKGRTCQLQRNDAYDRFVLAFIHGRTSAHGRLLTYLDAISRGP